MANRKRNHGKHENEYPISNKEFPMMKSEGSGCKLVLPGSRGGAERTTSTLSFLRVTRGRLTRRHKGTKRQGWNSLFSSLFDKDKLISPPILTAHG